jgi:DNA-binding transcriptional LysR family regulator
VLAIDDLPSLALFARVVHHRSFSAAAREAGIAKSAVSRRVARLEDQLGVRLLRRSTRTLSVTDEGLRVYEHAAALIAAAAAAEEAAGGTRDALRGTLRVNAPVTFSQMHLAAAAAEFLRANPGVELHLSTDDRFVDVVEGGYDIVVRIGRLVDSGMFARKLASDRLVVCASPDYLSLAGEPETPADLLAHNCLRYALISAAAEWRFRGAKGTSSLPVRGNLVTTDGTVLRESALAGLGLAVLPFFMVARDVAAGRLRLVLEGHRKAEIGIFAVTAHRTHAPARIRAFLDFLARRFARAGWDT